MAHVLLRLQELLVVASLRMIIMDVVQSHLLFGLESLPLG